MQIIIPMSGEGSRFKAAGYDILKPLIPMHGKPILEYVIDLFPGDHSFLFICREDHEQQYGLREYLQRVCPGAEVVTIPPPYPKLGPVYPVLRAEKFVKMDEPVIVSYCDYFMEWDFEDFTRTVTERGEDGNVICYTGFHPHLLHSKNVYAGCRVNDELDLLEIREKFSFEDDKTRGEHSVGAYYFKTGALMTHYFKRALDAGETVNGEHYVSLVYPFLIADGLRVKVYDKVPHFCQWGTPEDMAEYNYWSEIFIDHQYK